MDFRLYTVGCIELFESSTSSNLADEVMAILTKYGINIDMVYSATTDNGCNYVKAIQLLHKMTTEGQCENIDENSDSGNFYVEDVFEIDEDEEEAMDILISGVVEQLALNGKFLSSLFEFSTFKGDFYASFTYSQ